MLVRCILTEYAKEANPDLPRVIEDDLNDECIQQLNAQSYNIYYNPNYPSKWIPGSIVDGSQIDTFSYVFLDFDLKSGGYASKEAFVTHLTSTAKLPPSAIVDSGGGCHAYWQVSDLDAMSFLRLQRRLCRLYNTDEAVSKIYQLMRLPQTNNVKVKDNPKLCSILSANDNTYTSEQLNKWLPKITAKDEEYCKNHYARTYKINQEIKVDYKLPFKFMRLLKSSKEVKELYTNDQTDRSKADYRLAHLMHAESFTREEAMSVLVNCSKAINRSDVHRNNYALNIVDKVWVFEETEDKDSIPLSSSVKDILRRGNAMSGKRLSCWSVFDNTQVGFRTGHVMGLVGGSGSGKTTLTLNYMYWFAKLNPDSHHLFFSGEQPIEEIAAVWANLCSEDANDDILERMHILGNYDQDGTYRHMSLQEIEDYVFALEKRMKIKIGCLGIDHIGILREDGRNGEQQRIATICEKMKAVAQKTDTFLIMQSQTSREKAGQGDLELDIDAAYQSAVFEHFCDWLVTSWQPLNRIYKQAPHMTCNAYKYAKIRHKNVRLDKIQEKSVQILMFNPDTRRLSVMTQAEDIAFDHYNGIATQLRNKDRKREPTKRTKIDWEHKK